MSVIPDEIKSTSDSELNGHRFPTGFVWGAATAAFQIEGSTTVDGRSDSIWDEFCRRPGAVVAGDTGDPAADHYRRFGADGPPMAQLRLGADPVSLPLPRGLPRAGRGCPRRPRLYQRLWGPVL